MSKSNIINSVALIVTCSIDIVLRIVTIVDSYKQKHKVPEIPNLRNEEARLSDFHDTKNEIYVYNPEEDEWDIK